MSAAAQGRIDVLQEMIDAGMDVNAVDDGWTALHHACWEGQLEAVRFLLSAGADTNKQNGRDGRSAIHFACSVHHGDPATAIEIVDTLLSEGVKVDHKSRVFGTPPPRALLPWRTSRRWHST